MWFKRKPKNRRLGREHVLDVKLRSSQVRAARARVAAVGLTLVFTLVLGGLAVWRAGGWALDRLVYQNRAFALEHIDVETDGVISVSQLRRWSGARVGENLLALDLARIKRDLEMVSVVQSASVERVLPHTLRIRIIEREPLAKVMVARPGAPRGIEIEEFQIDAEGYVIAPLQPPQMESAPSQPPDQLPVLAGVNGNDVQAGRRLESRQVQAALRLLTAFERSPMAGLAEVKSVNVSVPEVLVASTSQGSEITFGLTSLELQLRRWQAAHEHALKLGKAIASLDLAVAENVPLRLFEATNLPPVRPNPPKNPKKRHV